MTEPLQLAGRPRRLLAWIIDAALVPALTVFLVMVTGVVEDAEDYADSWWMLWVLLLAIGSYLLLNGYRLWRYGQTLGKWCVGIAIVDAKPDAELDANLNAGVTSEYKVTAWWRLICLRAWFFPFSFAILIWPLLLLPLLDHLLIFGRKRRCLHDLVAGTQVVMRR
ncbi:MAG: RDD family protein [Pseudomonadota bacterium]